MKTNYWLILGTMIATSAVAQVNTNKLPEIPPPALSAPATLTPAVAPVETKTNAPVKKAVVKAKKKVVKKAKPAVTPVAKKIAEAPVTLVAGPATVAADNVNLRGQAGLQGEVVGHVKKGDSVTVLSEINLDKPKAGEPAQWAKVALPAGTKVWINSTFIDATNKVVSVKKLNLRGGPGENYSVLGVLEKGTAFTEVTSKGSWTQIETPTSAFAFVAASYLKQEAPGVPVPPVVAAVEPVAPTPTTVAEASPVAPMPAPNVPVAAPPTPEPVPTPAPVLPTLMVPPSAPAPEVDTNPPPPRIVTHEGTVRSSVSIVAPTAYELFDPANGKAINYLFSTTTNLNLTRYNGLRITVTGEEGMDARWRDTPVLTIQKIYVLSSAASKPSEPILKPANSSWNRR